MVEQQQQPQGAWCVAHMAQVMEDASRTRTAREPSPPPEQPGSSSPPLPTPAAPSRLPHTAKLPPPARSKMQIRDALS